MFRTFGLGLFVASLSAGAAMAVPICPGSITWHTLTNGSVANADEVMDNFNCLAPLITPNFTGNVGITAAAVSGYALSLRTIDSPYSSAVQIYTPSTGEQAAIAFYSPTVGWQIGKHTDDSFFIWDTAGARQVLDVASGGNMALMPSGGYVGIGSSSPAAPLDVITASGPTGISAMFGNSATYKGGVYFSDVNTINFNVNTNANSLGYINHNGYQNGTTQFRDLEIDNGEQVSIAFFQGATGRVGIGTTSPTVGTALDLGSNTTSANSSLLLPVGTTATRPTTGANGMLRYNSATPAIEAYVNGVWTALGASTGVGGPLSSVIAATAPQSFDNANFAQTWTWNTLTTQTALALSSTSETTGSLLTLTNSNTSGAGIVLNASSASTGGATVVRGVESGATGANYGVYGSAASATGAGIYGINTNTGAGAGVIGTTASTTNNAVGVKGTATGTSANVYGVQGTSASTAHGAGVYGLVSGTANTAYGVYGYNSDSTNVGEGVFGDNASTISASTSAYGVHGRMSGAGNRGAAVFGENAVTDNIGYGVYGTNASTTAGVGVFGRSTGSGNSSIGVQALNNAATNTGYALKADNSGTSGANYGVYGSVATTGAGFAVYGKASGSGNTSFGVYGTNSSTAAGTGVYGDETGSGNTGYAGHFDNSSANGWTIYVTGTSRNYFAGSVGIGTNNPAQKLEVNGQVQVDTLASASATALCISATTNGVLASCSSSRRYKENIKDATFGLGQVLAMRPVTFKWKGRDEKDFGFIAEEIAKIDPLFVTRKDGRIEGVKYPQLMAVLVNAVKQLKAANDSQAAEIRALRSRQAAELRELRSAIAELSKSVPPLVVKTAQR